MEIFLISLIIAILWFWSSALKAREFVFATIQAHCRKLNLQLLDDCVALNALWIKRNPQGKIQCWRSYLFEFSSTGFERYQGKIVILGNKVESIKLDPYRESQ